jgi:DNA-binding response OmpR family regulator
MNTAPPISVILVEDHGMLRQELVHYLRLRGFAADGVNCGLGLNDWLADQPRPPDIAVLDLNLPGEDGIEIARRLRKAYPDMGLIILTGRKSTLDKINGYESGADVYLAKPVEVEELTAVVSSLYRRMRMQSRPVPKWQLDMVRGLISSPRGLVGELSINECAVLACLARSTNQTAEITELLLQCANEQHEPEKTYLSVLLSRLRTKLAALVPGAEIPTIRANRGKGYQLQIPLEIR